MPVPVLAKQDLFLNGAKDKAVGQSDEAAFLIARKGRPIPPAHQHLVTKGGDLKAAKQPADKKPKAVKPAAKKAAKKPANKAAKGAGDK